MLESKYLKDDIKNIRQLLVIPSLRNFETSDLSRLLKVSKVRRYDDSEVIIKEGDLDHWLYFLLAGEVRVAKTGVDIGSLCRTGDLFGEMRLMDGLSRSATVYAVGNTLCLAVDIAAAHRLPFDGGPDSILLLLYRAIAEFASTRLRTTNEELIMAKREISELRYGRGHTGIWREGGTVGAFRHHGQ